MPPQHQYVIKNLWNAIFDAQNAIPILKSQIDANTSSIATTNETINNSTVSETIIQTSNTIGFVNNQTGVTTYSTQPSDNGSFIILSDASPIAVTLSGLGDGSGITLPFFTSFLNIGTGTATLTPTSGTINGNASFTLPGNNAVTVSYDGTNYFVEPMSAEPKNTPAILHEWINSYNSTTGAFTQTQPAFTDISGIATPAQLPLATSTTFGIVEPDNTTITVSAGVISTAGGVVPNFADSETPGGTINGSNVTFTLAHSPNPALSLQLNLSGLTQAQGVGLDYTLSGSTITFATAPSMGPLRAWYRY
jgi:hypothetical protein